MNVRVSAIMPTADRRRFVPDAIASFLAQAGDEAELLILDDGSDAVADLVPDDPRVRYLRETTRRPLGDKRNRLCALARGDIILHWDDDDWHAPDRIARQRAALDASGAEICGLDRVVFLSDDGAQAWDYVYRGTPPWVCGGSLAYRRAYWDRRPFPAIQCGEDTQWVFAAERAALHVMDAPDLFVGRVHAGNTSPKHTQGDLYQPRDPAPVRAMVARFADPPLAATAAILHDLTVVVPHGGVERLPLLTHALARLRDALPLSPLIVVELGETAVATEAAARAGARHVFVPHSGAFERARALNLGTAEARTDYVLWHDNDLVAVPGFHARAIAELEATALDFLIPYQAIHYLTDDDTRACLGDGADPPHARPLRTLRSGSHVSGGMGLVRRRFVEAYGGLDERFRGWGGEDNGWWHKASLLGRTGTSGNPEQTLYHLYHAESGGLNGTAPHRSNPHYLHNIAVLTELERCTTRDAWLGRATGEQTVATAAPASAAPLHLPLFLYWEGPCPDWILRCRETIMRHGGDVRLLDRAAFEALRQDDRDIDLDPLQPAHRADYARAYLLARHGGIWLDSDCILMRPLDRVRAALTAHGFVVHQDRQGYYPNGFIAAAPDNPTARLFYQAVADRLRSGPALSWISLGGEPLTRLLRQGRAAFHELPCAAIQPICWSQPELFFRTGDAAEHARSFDPDALTYMLSNTQITAFAAQHPGADLLAPRSFFRFALAKSLDHAAAPAGTLAEAGQGRTPAAVFAGFHAAAEHRGDDSLSGPGSSLAQTATLRRALPDLLADLGIGVLLDAGCGDHRWLGQTDLPVTTYIGVDIVPALIARNAALALPGRRFLCADVTQDTLPRADLVLLRDTLVHYDLATARRTLRALQRTGARWLLATTFTDRRANADCALGGWRPLNLTLAPFDLPPPHRLIVEGCTEAGGAYRDKALGLWRLDELQP